MTDEAKEASPDNPMTPLNRVREFYDTKWGKRAGERVRTFQKGIDRLTISEAREVLDEIKAERDDAQKAEEIRSIIESEIAATLNPRGVRFEDSDDATDWGKRYVRTRTGEDSE